MEKNKRLQVTEILAELSDWFFPLCKTQKTNKDEDRWLSFCPSSCWNHKQKYQAAKKLYKAELSGF